MKGRLGALGVITLSMACAEAPPVLDGAPEWRAERLLRLGALEGGPEAFGRIRSLIADEEGNLYVADNLAQEVRVFGPDGSHLRSLGRRGEGPGEFGDLYSLAWLGEELVAMDPRNARLALLTKEGEWRGSIRHLPITGPPTWVRLHPLGSEGFYTPVMAPERSGLQLARVTTTGTSDTFPVPRPPEGLPPSGMLCHRPDGAVTSISWPEAPAMVYGFPPSGGVLAQSWTDEGRIHFQGPAQDTLQVVERNADRVPYPDSLWEEGIRPFHELREQFPGMRCEPSAPVRPAYRAALRHFLFDETGRLWVEAAVEGGFRWEVFDLKGPLLGVFSAPPREARIPPYVRGGVLYQVEVDELGVEYVGVYRIVEEG